LPLDNVTKKLRLKQATLYTSYKECMERDEKLLLKTKYL